MNKKIELDEKAKEIILKLFNDSKSPEPGRVRFYHDHPLIDDENYTPNSMLHEIIQCYLVLIDCLNNQNDKDDYEIASRFNYRRRELVKNLDEYMNYYWP
ncbi:hypothetical protein HOA92_05525 [archaeon]|jgi:hypothetical protein|nr:hypothetical protein [archaeon]MBT6762473.1 hypothetical protein [archaeon]